MTGIPPSPLPPSPGGPYPEQSQATTVLVLGILSIVLCQLLGPVAWKLGSDEIRAITEGRRSAEGLGLAQAGRVCGIVGTCLLGLVVLFFVISIAALILGAGWLATSTRS
jgi:hypothetical protein